ncbi:hypothetical protein GCM10008995_04770 [Halobellus salinus]|uniref:Uncharacterized protein n=1 Tax=Halobellus salinus TaxID=931585 RepID=A0A830E6R7_9EURY|nr:hypothetical protein [Halobellus salinus]GGI97909.1 hypothetical protein GCM10008995_04770 [Halobellus salinus]
MPDEAMVSVYGKFSKNCSLISPKPADGVATVLFVRIVLRKESDPAEKGIALCGSLGRENEVYAYGLTVGAQARFSGIYRGVTKGDPSFARSKKPPRRVKIGTISPNTTDL